MKRLLGLMVAVLFVVMTVAGAGAIDLSVNLLTGFDFNIHSFWLVTEPRLR